MAAPRVCVCVCAVAELDGGVGLMDMVEALSAGPYIELCHMPCLKTDLL